jgi:ABC-type multidrug transport system permease subunit
MVMGKSVMGMMRGAAGGMIIFCIGLLLSPELSLTPMFAASIMLSCMTFSFLGVSAALLSKTHQSMSTFSNLVILPMTFLCGTFFSVSSMDPAIKAALYAFPLTHSTETARAAALGWDFPWASFAVLAVFCAAFFALNVHLIKSKKV